MTDCPNAFAQVCKCFISPEAKTFFHKKDIKTRLDLMLVPEREPKKDNARAVVSVHDSIPTWPVQDWLPRDWRIAFRQLPSGVHKVFIPPGQEEGLCYCRPA